MTYHWAHAHYAKTQHAYKNQIPGLPSACGRGRFPQDAASPTIPVPACKWCAAVTKPPNAETLGGSFEKGYPWAQHSDWHRVRAGKQHHSPEPHSRYGDS